MASLLSTLDCSADPTGSTGAGTPVHPDVEGWAEQMQRQFIGYRAANPQGQCWLLLDPSIYRPDDVLGIGPQLAQLTHPIQWRHRSLVPEHRPYLVPVEMDRLHGSMLLNTSLQHSYNSWQRDSICRGFGHSVCGWLFSSADGKQLSEHLGDLAVQPLAGIHNPALPKRMLLRYWDPSVLPQLWDILNTQQRRMFLGPLYKWYLLDRFHRLRLLNITDNERAPRATTNSLALSELQWLAIQNISALNAALIETLAQQEDLEISEPLLKAVTRTLIRGRRAGIHDAQDMTVFARHALQIHPEFDTHPLVQECLLKVKECLFYSASVSNLTTEKWQAVRDYCHVKRAPSSNTKIYKTP